MSINIKNLTKIYGAQRAVDDISFEVGEGEIVGFLGPNGAGKSTTMKIATCYLPPTEGRVEVLGHNVLDEPVKVRKNIGYLPEHNPLYEEMYIHEYLRFIGRLYGLRGGLLKQQVGKMIEICGLEREQNKKIETLSKGYRQRTGLAQSLIHDPKVLVLDEPTTGLDPNQIVEIRELIRDVSKDKTVIFSTHIMQEVEALCNRVIVINKGKLIADSNVADLRPEQSEMKVHAEFSGEVDYNIFKTLDSIEKIEPTGDGKVVFYIKGGQDIRSEIFALASEHKLPIVGLRIEEISMEGIFRQLTKEEKPT